MSTHDEPPVRVAGIGLSSQIRQRLEQIFREYASSRYTIVEESLAEAAIVDLDGFAAGEAWRHYRSHHPTLPTVVLSLQPRRIENTLFVQKPVESAALLDALARIKKQVKANRQAAAPLSGLAQPLPAIAGADAEWPWGEELGEAAYYNPGALDDSLCPRDQLPRDINPARPDDLARAYYEPSGHLQGIVQHALSTPPADNSLIKLNLPGGTLLLLPARNQAFYTGREEYWRSLAVQPLIAHQSRSEYLSAHNLGQYLRGAGGPLHWQYLDRFLWKIALWSAHGRVPNGINLHTPIVLLHWPNFTRLLLTPHALQIAALWRKQPYSLLETAKLLSIRQCYVFGFFSATHATGMAFPDRRGPRPAESGDLARIVSEAESQPQKRSLFQRILAHLRGA